MSINRPAAIDATRRLLIAIGGMSLAAFVANCHWYLYAPTAVFISVTWYVLYQIEIHPKRDAIQRIIENSAAWKAVHQ